MTLQLLCSPIGNRNFWGKLNQNIAKEGTPYIVESTNRLSQQEMESDREREEVIPERAR